MFEKACLRLIAHSKREPGISSAEAEMADAQRPVHGPESATVAGTGRLDHPKYPEDNLLTNDLDNGNLRSPHPQGFFLKDTVPGVVSGQA